MCTFNAQVSSRKAYVTLVCGTYVVPEFFSYMLWFTRAPAYMRDRLQEVYMLYLLVPSKIVSARLHGSAVCSVQKLTLLQFASNSSASGIEAL